MISQKQLHQEALRKGKRDIESECLRCQVPCDKDWTKCPICDFAAKMTKAGLVMSFHDIVQALHVAKKL